MIYMEAIVVHLNVLYQHLQGRLVNLHKIKLQYLMYCPNFRSQTSNYPIMRANHLIANICLKEGVEVYQPMS